MLRVSGGADSIAEKHARVSVHWTIISNIFGDAMRAMFLHGNGMARMDKKKRDFWKTIGNCCGAKIKYEINDHGTMVHSCRGCGKILWSNMPYPSQINVKKWTPAAKFQQKGRIR